MAKELKQSATPTAPRGGRRSAGAAATPQERYGDDMESPLAAGAAGVSDRFSDDPSGSAGEAALPDAGGMPMPAPGMADLTPEEEEDIRSRAYSLWEEAGRPEGDHETHWHRAREEMRRQRDERGDAS